MNPLRVVPTRRHGQERLYVCLTDGRNVAWYDRATARVNLLSENDRDGVLEALGPFLTGPVTVGPPPVPTPAELARLALHPDDDLAPNRPGEALHIALDRDPGAPQRFRADPRRHALEAEQAVGEALERLTGGGWYALHSIPLPGGDRVHHLVIGPGGLYAVHTLYARRCRVTVADPMVTLGRRDARPVLRRARADAGRASYALTAEVRPLLVLYGATEVTVPVPPRSVRVLRETEVGSLAGAGGVLKPADVEALHAMARDRGTWERV
ncbi:nuclease-related domain-containing protein [Streptomyces sp. NPDC094437]|uniref:nuclease-related domain-containing protein n=1 Tax=Streptomyces sp. NPDC094437 TaxID=3366060 RepID=UPI0037F460B4